MTELITSLLCLGIVVLIIYDIRKQNKLYSRIGLTLDSITQKLKELNNG